MVRTKFLIFIFSCSIALAGPWDDFVRTSRQQEGGRSRWVLCLKASLLSPQDLLRDAEYQKLATGGDWGVQVLGTPQAQDLQATKGADWALLSPAGEVAGTGQGRPLGTRLLEVIHASGAKARWEVRSAFLADHPLQGEARLEHLFQELRLLRSQVASLDHQGKVKVPAWHQEPGGRLMDERITLAGAEGDALADDLYGGVGAALKAMRQVPGWTREARAVATRLDAFDLGQAGSLRRLFAELAPEVEDRVAADPDDAGLVHLWMECLDGARLLPESLGGKVAPVPGTSWPHPDMINTLAEPFRRRGDWGGETRLLTDFRSLEPPVPLAQRGWEEYCDLQAALIANQAMAQAARGAWDEAKASLDEALHWGGTSAVRSAVLRRGFSVQGGGDSGAWRRLLGQMSTQKAGRPPRPEAPAPLRLTLMGRPAWLVSWTLLRDAAELAAWSPGELRWDIATPEVHARSRSRHGWDASPRWVLFQGEEVLASGQTCPEPKGLAAVLAGHGLPMLERLGRFLARHPGHMAAHRARFQVLLTRMPDRRLEPILAEDAARAHLTLPFDPGAPWKPDENVWGGAAQAVLPELEALLKAWPTDNELWQAWVSWAHFHPGRPSILLLAQGLPYWNPAGDWRAGLPFGVLRTVAAELRSQGSFQAMRDWFQASWDKLDHRPLKDLRPWERHWVQTRRADEETAVFQPLRDALRGLGLTEQQLELERVFGAMMGRDETRSR